MSKQGTADQLDQLDLFADIDAAQREQAAIEERRRLERAPSLFAGPQRGFRARHDAYTAWVQEYGHFGSLRRSHAWHAEIASRDDRTAQCQAALLCADLRCEHYDDDCSCVGDLYYRGACLHCAWEGDVRDEASPAVEDAHDHAWPGWRTLPIVARPPEHRSTAKQQAAATAAWVRTVELVYPQGWLHTGGPIRTERPPLGSRHVPRGSGFGGYDLAVVREPT